ncbi:MAG: SGNH/GDSL hydrolase family protein [Acidobacteria bacterium]|nr:MAG: SGNH/GDSL hydrolase family protein [Acidobacteriota bacterium]
MSFASLVVAVLIALSPVAQAVERRVLFIGNSLTVANGLPQLVEQFSAAAGAPLKATVVAFPDFSLGDHWERGDALRAIRRGGWDAVVLQQGPSSLPESRVSLIADTRRFDAEIRKAGARTALFMVWPPRARARFAPDVSKSYADAAAAVGGLLLPVGDVWRAALSADASLALYGPDDFHPSPLGSRLAARVIVEGLTGKTVPR